ncbi:MAG TPA: methylmalonyl Co-A mutase-associated GTPase MeaB [Flavobacterium sp.]
MDNQKSHHSALSEKDGVIKPEEVSVGGAERIVALRQKSVDPKQLAAGILNGNITDLSRAITLIESSQALHSEMAAEVITSCLPHSGRSIRIGITGVPGVGKSTFIEAFGKHLTSLGKKVAVLAVDPSSTISHGSILGDKTRMEELVKDKNAYIRPSAAGETLGGVARKTRETITLCEAAGFDVIIVETVGVGQSETAVHSMVDFFLLLKIAGAGDELQGIKRGIMEMADAIVINKADGDNIKKARLAKTEFTRALHLFPAKNSGWMPTVATCSAITQDGIADVWKVINEFLAVVNSNGHFNQRRIDQNLYWLTETINDELKSRFYSSNVVNEQLSDIQQQVRLGELSPFLAAQLLLKNYLG